MPPHIDRGRSLAINYFVDLGGEQVQTIFYSVTAPVHPDKSINVRLNETGAVLDKVIFKPGWHAFRTDHCHCVENIETTRIYIAIKILNSNHNIDNNYSFDNFLNDYPELIFSQIQD